jgi:hypothetical protein
MTNETKVLTNVQFSDIVQALNFAKTESDNYQSKELHTANLRLYSIIFDCGEIYRSFKGTASSHIEDRKVMSEHLRQLNKDARNYIEKPTEVDNDDLPTGILRYVFSVTHFTKDQLYSYRNAIKQYFSEDNALTREQFVQRIVDAGGINTYVRSLAKGNSAKTWSVKISAERKQSLVEKLLAETVNNIELSHLTNICTGDYAVVLAVKEEGVFKTSEYNIFSNANDVSKLFQAAYGTNGWTANYVDWAGEQTLKAGQRDADDAIDALLADEFSAEDERELVDA